MGLWKKGLTSLIPPQGYVWYTTIASLGLGVMCTSVYFGIQNPRLVLSQSPQQFRLLAQPKRPAAIQPKLSTAQPDDSSVPNLSPGRFW